MSLSGAQHGLYNRLFKAVLAARPDADRLAMHAELGLPASRSDWTNEHFDCWKAACLAISQPGNLQAQLAQQKMPEKRQLVAIGRLLDALGENESYALTIVQQMNSAGRIGQPWAEDRAYVRDAAGKRVFFDYAHTVDGEPARKGLTLAHLDLSELKKIVVALKKEAKRRWRTKAALTTELSAVLEGVDAHFADIELCRALNCRTVAPLALTIEMATYEQLLIMLGVIRRLRLECEHDAAEPAPRFRGAEEVTDDLPF